MYAGFARKPKMLPRGSAPKLFYKIKNPEIKYNGKNVGFAR